jgi:hypothetical protein
MKQESDPPCRPLGFALVAITLGMAVPAIHMIVEWVTGQRTMPTPPRRPPTRAWLRQYRKNKCLARWVRRTMPGVADDRAHRRLVEWPPDLGMLAQELLQPPGTGGSTGAAIEAVLQRPESFFFVRVELPCQVLYREPPGLLMRRARLGDLDALDKLIRLDKTVLCDPMIAEHWTRLMDLKPTQRQRWLTAVAGHPKKVDEKFIRTSLAALLLQESIRQDCRMTSTEIREFFEMFVPGYRLDDHEMPFGEALTKALQRQRTWQLRSQAN